MCGVCVCACACGELVFVACVVSGVWREVCVCVCACVCSVRACVVCVCGQPRGGSVAKAERK